MRVAYHREYLICSHGLQVARTYRIMAAAEAM
jgi:hypothetical protein